MSFLTRVRQSYSPAQGRAVDCVKSCDDVKPQPVTPNTTIPHRRQHLAPRRPSAKCTNFHATSADATTFRLFSTGNDKNNSFGKNTSKHGRKYFRLRDPLAFLSDSFACLQKKQSARSTTRKTSSRYSPCTTTEC